MNKEWFLSQLRRRLADLPEAETEKSLRFYAESIDDRVEDGMSEAEAVAALGSLDDIERSIRTDLPLTTLVRRRVDARRASLGPLWIVLAVLGFPIWLPLLLTAAVLALSVYLVIWAVIVSLFAALLAVALLGAGLAVYGLGRLLALGLYPALMVLGAAAVCVGAVLALLYPACLLARGLSRLTGRFGRWIKGLFLRKGGETR